MRKVAIIMSLYKNDTLLYVQQAVESIVNQSYSLFDFYIQYDGNIPIDVDGYLSSLKDERIRIFKRDKNKGLAYSLNELLSRLLPMGY